MPAPPSERLAYESRKSLGAAYLSLRAFASSEDIGQSGLFGSGLFDVALMSLMPLTGRLKEDRQGLQVERTQYGNFYSFWHF